MAAYVARFSTGFWPWEDEEGEVVLDTPSSSSPHYLSPVFVSAGGHWWLEMSVDVVVWGIVALVWLWRNVVAVTGLCASVVQDQVDRLTNSTRTLGERVDWLGGERASARTGMLLDGSCAGDTVGTQDRERRGDGGNGEAGVAGCGVGCYQAGLNGGYFGCEEGADGGGVLSTSEGLSPCKSPLLRIRGIGSCPGQLDAGRRFEKTNGTSTLADNNVCLEEDVEEDNLFEEPPSSRGEDSSSNSTVSATANRSLNLSRALANRCSTNGVPGGEADEEEETGNSDSTSSSDIDDLEDPGDLPLPSTTSSPLRVALVGVGSPEKVSTVISRQAPNSPPKALSPPRPSSSTQTEPSGPLVSPDRPPSRDCRHKPYSASPCSPTKSPAMITRRTAPHELIYKAGQRYRIFRELLATEGTYCSGLWTLIDVIAETLKTANFIPVNDLCLIFPKCLPQLYQLHANILMWLERYKAELPGPEKLFSVGGISLTRSPLQTAHNEGTTVTLAGFLLSVLDHKDGLFFQLYRDYLRDFALAVDTIRKYTKQSSKFRKLVKSLQFHSSCEGLPLSAFLLTPVQRLPRYLLMVRQFLANTPEDHAERRELELLQERLRTFLDEMNASMDASLHSALGKVQNSTKKKRRDNISGTGSCDSIHLAGGSNSNSNVTAVEESGQTTQTMSRGSGMLTKLLLLNRQRSNTNAGTNDGTTWDGHFIRRCSVDTGLSTPSNNPFYGLGSNPVQARLGSTGCNRHVIAQQLATMNPHQRRAQLLQSGLGVKVRRVGPKECVRRPRSVPPQGSNQNCAVGEAGTLWRMNSRGDTLPTPTSETCRRLLASSQDNLHKRSPYRGETRRSPSAVDFRTRTDGDNMDRGPAGQACPMDSCPGDTSISTSSKMTKPPTWGSSTPLGASVSAMPNTIPRSQAEGLRRLSTAGGNGVKSSIKDSFKRMFMPRKKRSADLTATSVVEPQESPERTSMKDTQQLNHTYYDENGDPCSNV